MPRFQSFLRFVSPVTGLALLVASVILLWPHAASAQYVQNNLISDSIYLNSASMTQAQIQTFLANRGGYIANYQVLFDCASTGTASNSAYVAAGAPCGQTVYASSIIYYASQIYGINPQVVMATMQKEESLVTDPNPAASQLNFAMGYGCADSTGCSQDSGFLHQVDDATWQLRLNYERAWGDNTWWDSQYGYACPNATEYYSTGLYPGRYVTFYDDYGTAYDGFVINDGATASLYCYTPHAYPGSAQEYYSGSYNFVESFEQWFGSTQPAVEITSPLRVSTTPEGVFANAPTTASFDMTNTTGSPVTVDVAVTVRDASGGNHDYGLQDITVPANGSATYSSTQTITSEGTYTFGITSFTNDAWDITYPTSSNIDNTRTVSATLQSIPTIISSPTSGDDNMRVGKTDTMQFTVENNSASSMNLGSLALGIRDPDGDDVDCPLVSVGTLAAGTSYTYSEPFVPPIAGTYSANIISTQDNGVTWDASSYPATANGVSRTFSFTVKPSPTITASLTSDTAIPRVGQTYHLSYNVENWGDSSVNLGYVGLGGRSPTNSNVDPGVVPVTLSAGQTLTISYAITPTTAGTYNYFVLSTNDYRTWGTGPPPESGSITTTLPVTVKPSPTITASLTSDTAIPRVGQTYHLSYNVENWGDSSVNLGYVGLGGRSPTNSNVDPGVVPVTLSAGQTLTISYAITPTTAGTYNYFVLSTNDYRTWGTGPPPESGSITTTLPVTVKPSPTITASLTSDTAIPRVGQTYHLSYNVENWGDSSVNLGYVGLGGRSPTNSNVDPGVVPVTLSAGQTLTISYAITPTTAGTYNYFVLSTNDYRTWGTGPPPESGSITTTLPVTVSP